MIVMTMRRRLLNVLRARDRLLARLVVHELALRELLLKDIHFLDVVEPGRPLAGAQADDAADDFRQTLQDD